MMKIVVCIKQVPDTNEVKIDPKTGTLIREGVPSIINPEDKNALEEALKIKEEHGAEVTVISMGPPQAKVALREALAMGADQAILLSDRAFAGADTWATAYTLSRAVAELGDVRIIFCGRQAIDGDTAQVGPQLAENLDIPQITYVQQLEIAGEKVIARRKLEDGYSVIETELPVLLTVVESINEPRYPSMQGIVEAHEDKEVLVWSAGDFAVAEDKIGLKASPTQVFDTFVPTHKRAGEILDGTDQEKAKALLEKLQEVHLI